MKTRRPRHSALAVSAAALALAAVNCGTSPAAPSAAAPWDYADRSRWIARADNPTLDADVFCVYPTTYNGDDLVAAGLDDGMAAGARAWLANDASCMEGAGNLFAPYYRQANAIRVLSLPPAERTPIVRGVPYHDVEAAFDYYLRNLNDGRPFILFGHSQGANVLLFLLEDYMPAHPEAYRRMIAAYILGVSVTTGDLARYPHLAFAGGADDTGVIISYNTEAPGVTANPLVLDGALAINPVNWRRDETPAPAAENAGSRIAGARVDGYADARVNLARGVVECATAPADNPLWALPPPFPPGSFHQGDIPFYYYNLRENARRRVRAFVGDGGRPSGP